MDVFLSSWTLITRATKWCQSSKLLLAKDLLKDIFKGLARRTTLTNTLPFLTML